MTLRFEQLEELMFDIKSSGFNDVIVAKDLDKFIGKHFGLSENTLLLIKKRLVQFGFLKVKGINVFEIIQTV